MNGTPAVRSGSKVSRTMTPHRRPMIPSVTGLSIFILSEVACRASVLEEVTSPAIPLIVPELPEILLEEVGLVQPSVGLQGALAGFAGHLTGDSPGARVA